MNKIISIALVAITVMMLAFTTTMTWNVNVQGENEPEVEDEDSIALDMEKESSNPSGEKVKNIQSNENSDNAAVELERSFDHSVKQEPSDEPAHTSTRTVEKGDTITEITRESAPQSSRAPGQVEIEQEAEGGK